MDPIALAERHVARLAQVVKLLLPRRAGDQVTSPSAGDRPRRASVTKRRSITPLTPLGTGVTAGRGILRRGGLRVLTEGGLGE
jgi:hypothetical protein